MNRRSSAAIDLGTSIGPDAGTVAMLRSVFCALDSAAISYCVLHGYETYSREITSDVDGILDHRLTPPELYRLLHRNKAQVGDLVVCNGHYVVLAGKSHGPFPVFVALDFTRDCDVEGIPVLRGGQVLAARRKVSGIWIPSSKVDFFCYLCRSILKGRFEPNRAERLSRLYTEDQSGCEQLVAGSWRKSSAEVLLAAAKRGNWQEVRERLGLMRRQLRRRAILRSPIRFLRNKAAALSNRIGRILRPNGLTVVFLGPDGAGKSSVIDAVGPALIGAFAQWTCAGFAPSVLQRLTGSRPRRTDQPHALPPRSLFTSLIRAAYWLAYYTWSYPALHLARARSTLVLNDRHFLDILVDQRRYRYGGPLWLLRLIRRLIPKPDLVILLDAPPEVLQARKQELSFAETARQCNAYLALMPEIQNGYVVNSSQPFDRVVEDVSELILQHLHRRIVRRFGLDVPEDRAPAFVPLCKSPLLPGKSSQ